MTAEVYGALVALGGVAVWTYVIYTHGIQELLNYIAQAVGSVCEIIVWGADGRPEPPSETERLEEQYRDGELTLEEFESRLDETLDEEQTR